MVTRLETGVGGTVGPQGGATVTIPADNAVNRSLSVPMEGVYAPPPSASPFALYNFTQDAAGATILGRGTSGNKFRVVKDGSAWENSNYVSGYEDLEPQYSTLDDFGGPWCDNPLSVVIATTNSGGDAEVSWRMTSTSAWEGLDIYTDIDIQGPDYTNSGTGDPYIMVEMRWPALVDPLYTSAFWDLAGATLGVDNLFVLTFYPGSDALGSLSINGAAYTAGQYLYHEGPSCATYNEGDYPAPRMKSDVYTASNVKGMAWTRSAANNAYWSAYDWATHPGFA